MKSVGILFISFNNISRLVPGTFSNVKITQIDLSNNLLTKLENDTFDDVNQLSTIDFSSNMISMIEAGAFNGLTSLQYIHLEWNNLTRLDNSTFAGCNNLQVIYLNNNPNLDKTNVESLCPTTAPNCKVYF